MDGLKYFDILPWHVVRGCGLCRSDIFTDAASGFIKTDSNGQ